MKKFLIFIFVLFFGIINCFADEVDIPLEGNNSGNIENVQEIQENGCQNNKYDLIGDFDLKNGNIAIFSIRNNLIGESDSGYEVVYSLEIDNEILVGSNLKEFNYKFEEVGTYVLKASVIENGQDDCEYYLEKEVNIYSKIITFISDRNDKIPNLDDDFKLNNILFYQMLFDNKSNVLLQDIFLSTVEENHTIFSDTDIFIINSNSYLQFLQGFDKLKKVYNEDFINKKIYIISDSNTIFNNILIKKFLNDYDYIGSLSSKFYTMENTNLLNFLNYLSEGKSSEDLLNDRNYDINVISYSQEKNKFLFITNFMNKLISNGFPMEILGIIFALSVAVTIINFIRQFIGFSIFSLYYPIFIALSAYIFSLDITVVLILSSLASICLIKLIFGKTHFLVNTKLALYFITYLLISVCFIGIFSYLNFTDFGEINTNMIIFPFTIIPMVIYRVFADERKIFSWGFLFYVFEFLFVITISYLVIKSTFIQYLFLAYSELLIVMLILNILIGKFTGLQVLEYIRFIPLIKRHLSSEEE